MVEATHDGPRAGAVEHRSFDLVEIRAERAEAGRPSRITGHAAVFNKLSDPIAGGFRERIRPGAFSNTIRIADVRALFNHDTNYVLGRVKSGTLRLREDAVGLWFETEPPDTSWASDLMMSIDRGDIDQASFGFRAIKDRFTQENGQTIRELLEVELFDVSPVTFPAYPQTDIQARSTLASRGIDRDALAGAVVRAERGIGLTDTDRDTIRSSIEVLRHLLPTSWAAPISVLRRRLQLAEAELGPAPVIWRDHAAGRFAYREVNRARVAEDVRATAAAAVRAASDELGLRGVRLRWFEPLPAGTGEPPAFTSDNSIMGQAQIYRTGVPEAWVLAKLSRMDAAETVAHECQHLYQQQRQVVSDRQQREWDAETYGRRFVHNHTVDLTQAPTRHARKDPWYNW